MLGKLVSLTALATAVAVLAPAAAQDLSSLPDRPIARAEVAAVVRKQFAQMDANHDGVVTQPEFQRFLTQQGDAPASGIAALAHVGGHWFERADANADGRVTLAEAGERPLHLFDMADANHDGSVSVAERRVATALMAIGGR